MVTERWMDSFKTVICPSCGEKMKKIFIPQVGFNVDICTDGCGGIFFDNRELEILKDNTIDISDITGAYGQNKSYSNNLRSQKRICPACGTYMVKNSFYVGSTGEVDNCYNCGAIFLDYGEFEAIRRSNSLSHRKIPEQNLTNDIKSFKYSDRSIAKTVFKSFVRLLYHNLH